MLRLRTHLGRSTAVRYLDTLSAALKPLGYRAIRLYRPEEFPVPVALPALWEPFLWVYVPGPHSHVGTVVSARAVSGGMWAYHEAQRGRFGYLSPCGDVKAAADQTDKLLKHRMFPGNAW
ncbi:hypothetical protein D0T12_04870 [Actinomadura spongiicola]|uniref:Uncharacterized protein n=1 Tax=Actinomadura spongiicola TaxID=2303421 RepID=A0A372GKT9_9ACTN|nr:hypothetical protein D0T12_04870 [Actinomadura spongiicola]